MQRAHCKRIDEALRKHDALVRIFANILLYTHQAHIRANRVDFGVQRVLIPFFLEKKRGCKIKLALQYGLYTCI